MTEIENGIHEIFFIHLDCFDTSCIGSSRVRFSATVCLASFGIHGPRQVTCEKISHSLIIVSVTSFRIQFVICH